MGIYDTTLDSIQVVSETDHTYYIQGTNFTPSSQVKINGEWYDTVYVNPTKLIITGKELETDAVCDGTDVFVPGIMQHVERTGIHSGDSISVYPARSISQKAKDNISSAVRDANNILDFLDSEGYVAFKADYEASTKNLYAAYKRWCEDNAENPLSPKSFANQLSQNAERYHLEPVSNLHIGGGKRCRGYMGIYILLSPMEL